MFDGICKYNSEILPKTTRGGGGQITKEEKQEIINYDIACGLAMSRLGLSVFEFYKTTPIEFYYALKDNKEWEEGKLNVIVRTIYESMRLQTVFIHNMNPHSKRAIRKPESLLKFEWDKIKQSEVQTLEEMKHALFAIAKRYKKKGTVI